MRALTFDIHLLEPAIVSKPDAGEENSAVSQSYIPGSTIMGTVIGEYMRRYDIKDAAVDQACRRLFFDGSTCFLNAYLNIDSQRSLPKPMSWFVKKDDVARDDAVIYDFGVEVSDKLEDAKSPQGDYCCRYDGGIYISSPKYMVMPHNTGRDRNKKREGDSTVYRYESLMPDQVLSGAVISGNDEDLGTIKDILDKKHIKIGMSRSAGYGLAEVKNITIKDWEEYDPDKKHCNQIMITLLSDTIVIDKCGQNTLDPSALFGVKPKKAYYAPEVVAGFNRKWGLPLPQMWAFEAGSVFAFDTNSINSELLKKAREYGIGERRAEGFGRIAVNWHCRKEYKREKAEQEFESEPKTLDGKSASMAKKLVEKRWRSLLDDKLAKAVNNITIKGNASRTQLSRIRVLVHKMWLRCDDNIIKVYLQELNGKAKEQLNVKVGAKELLEWLNDNYIPTAENYCFKICDKYFQLEDVDEPSLGGVKISEEDRHKLMVEYAARLLDGILKKLLEEGEAK